MKSADNSGIAAGEHAQDAPLGTAVVALASQFHQHMVAMHGRTDGLRVDVNVASESAALTGVRDDETVAVAVHRQASGEEVLISGRMFRQGVTVASGLDQARAFHERLQPFGELLPLAAAQAHLADELLEPRRAVRLALDVA